MNKVSIQNLAMIIINKCNLNCKFCLMGHKNNKNMSKEVVETIFRQIVEFENLCICGSEPTLTLAFLEYIFHYIINNKILLDQVSITINSINYHLEFLKLLNYINDYLLRIAHNNRIALTISYDQYHKKK